MEIINESKCNSVIRKNIDKIDWVILSYNPNAIHLLSKLDTEKMKQNNKIFAEELVAYVFNPLRLNRLCDKYKIELDELVELCW